MTQLANSNVVITGAASGIGLLLARRVVERGGRPILLDVDQDALDAAVGQLRTAVSHRCDVTDRSAVFEVRDRVLEECGPVDVLVNNAGVVSGAALVDLEEASIRRTFEVNAIAPFWLTQAFLPGMLERDRGHVVTIASASGLVGVVRLSDYASSKWAAVGFDESLRMELRAAGSAVRTTVVCPYYIDTGMFAGVRTRYPWLLPILRPEPVVDKIVRAIESDRPRLVLPPAVRAIALGRLLPVRAFDWIVDHLGIGHSMDHFTGRSR
ncbi:MAG: SDR family oxidoreductase [Microthrixaceae bacterium]